MAAPNWTGGTTAVTQVATGTVAGDWDNPDTCTTTLLTEDGVSQAVTTTSTGPTEETQTLDIHLAALQASTLSMFLQATWTKGSSTTIVATAKIAGRPLSGGAKTNVVVGSQSAAGTGTYSYADTTTNAGPNDANTAANWSTGTSPATADTVKLLPHPTDVDVNNRPVSYDIRYGLNFSAVALNTLNIGKAYRGIIGDPINGFYWKIDVTNGTAKTVIDSNSPSIWLQGAHTQINVAGLPTGSDALHIKGGVITTLRLLGSGVRGKVNVADSCVVGTIESLGANMPVHLGTETGTLMTAMTIDGGDWLVERGCIASTGIMDILGGVVRVTAGAVPIMNNYGGVIYPNGTGTIAALNNYRGTTNFEENITAGITVTAAKIWSGAILDKSGLANVTYTANVIVYGGTVTSDTATTQTQTA